jgi:hypothetical protein
MPCLNGKFNPQVGPLINVKILGAGTMTLQNTAFPSTALDFVGLIDTGASRTCITPKVAQDVGLSAVSKMPFGGVHGLKPVNVYLIDIVVPMMPNSFFLGGIPAMELAAIPNSPFEVLIGRDLICRGVLTLGSDGHFSFCL